MPILFILAAMAAQNASPPSIDGRWKSPGGNSIIEIAPCGESHCGTVVWASDKAKQDARKTTNQLVGTALLTNLELKRGDRWQGKLFIPDKNIRATAKLELISPEQLKVSGCAAGKALCKSASWTRAEGPLPTSN
jgi:uncharacterized protein (DUF2147 family)